MAYEQYPQVYIYFPDAMNDPPLYKDGRILVIPEFVLAKNDERGYSGVQTIVYRNEEDKPIAFAVTRVLSIPYVLQNATTVISISPEEANLQYDANRATVSLGVAAIALGIGALMNT